MEETTQPGKKKYVSKPNGPTELLYHKLEKQDDGKFFITGWCPKIEIGDEIEISGAVFEVEKIEKKDHKGRFTDPELAKGSYFEAYCKQNTQPTTSNEPTANR